MSSDLKHEAMRMLHRDNLELLDLSSDDHFGAYPTLRARYASTVAERPGSREAMLAAYALQVIDYTLEGKPIQPSGPRPVPDQ